MTPFSKRRVSFWYFWKALASRESCEDCLFWNAVHLCANPARSTACTALRAVEVLFWTSLTRSNILPVSCFHTISLLEELRTRLGACDILILYPFCMNELCLFLGIHREQMHMRWHAWSLLWIMKWCLIIIKPTWHTLIVHVWKCEKTTLNWISFKGLWGFLGILDLKKMLKEFVQSPFLDLEIEKFILHKTMFSVPFYLTYKVTRSEM